MITEVSYETLQKKKTLVVDAVLSPTPRACRSCGSTVVDGNGKAIIVKNGKKETIVRFEQYNHICADGETGKLIDVLPTRKLPRLTS
ncbi:hypothetical protein EfmAA94_30450 (plasmid) [Enterococcus faecium]|nr:hypothetical protein EfmAA94_30450 [Enterococcus faecium]